MGNFFERKQTKKTEIKNNFGDFDFTKESDLESCGLEKNGIFFTKRNHEFSKKISEELNENEINDKKMNNVAIVAKLIEEHFSSREISFLLSKSFLNIIFSEEQKQLNEQKQ